MDVWCLKKWYPKEKAFGAEVYWSSRPSAYDLVLAGVPSQPYAEALLSREASYIRDGSGEWHLMLHSASPAGTGVVKKFAEFQETINTITYKPGWYFRTGVEEGRMWVQVGVTEEAEISFDPIAGKKVPWRGAKLFLSEHMCRNEIVSTVFHAIERAELHEVREWFRYKGRSIFNPHLDPDALAELAGKAKNFNVRTNAMTMEEPT